ncbi:MAG: sigma 54-dependent Fis family transcriptional regulator, partial [Myxococcales bacterium]|nr:sigma 54-dependent Fis family transcriptional regulator [Myxococcales bacterium]
GVLELSIPDRWMSSTHAELERLVDRWILRDAGSRNGSLVDGVPAAGQELRPGALIELGHTFLVLQLGGLARGTDGDDGRGFVPAPAPGLVTFDADWQATLARLATIAKTSIAVLLEGETGTGKEVVARALHRLSGRAGEFVGVNAAALPDSLAESELFGHRKGAFSGALVDHPGLIRSASGGTLFLDEIAELRPPVQAMLLRALQEREVRAVGDTRARPVDLRLVCATHESLARLVDDGRFRRDLYARIAGVRLELPPLRRRRVDLGLLIAALLPRVCEHPEQVQLSTEAARALLAHDWPMNVRELDNCLLSAVALAGGKRVELEHLPAELAPEPEAIGPPESGRGAGAPDRTQIEAALAEHEHNVSRAARALGLSRQALYRRMQRLGISRPDPTEG